MRIHVVVNTHRADAVDFSRQIAKWLTRQGIDVAAERDAAPALDLSPVEADGFTECDLVIAFGGDGTLIRACHHVSTHGVPVLGVYFGRFGFVTQAEPSRVEAILKSFLAGKARIERRMMLEVELLRGDRGVTTIHALNEVALQRAVTSRMMVFEVTVDGHTLTRYPADGVLVCAPTGSTAYNLSVGGPLMDPRLEAMAITAIAPHTLNSRPFVLSPHSEILLSVQDGDGDSTMSIDGRTRLHLMPRDVLRIRKSGRVTNLVAVSENDFLTKVGERLLWSKGLIPEGL